VKLFVPLIICALLLPALLHAQEPGVSVAAADTAVVAPPPTAVEKYNAAIQSLLSSNIYLNSSGQPASLGATIKQRNEKNYLFYLLLGLVSFLAILRFFYARYFTNLFRVFFNTSLRQSQLTDQLLQAKLPSLLYNLLFVVSGGFFLYLVLSLYNQLPPGSKWWLTIPACIAAIGIIYLAKYATLKFTGWITSYKSPLDTYTFVVFLINKIIGILLVPFVVVMAFAAPDLAQTAAVTALLITALMLLLRFVKSYGLLQGQVKVSRFHFFLYILGIEVLPLLLIYKALMIYLTKKI
jgi:Domain of unknown function (DUF4271)